MTAIKMMTFLQYSGVSVKIIFRAVTLMTHSLSSSTCKILFTPVFAPCLNVFTFPDMCVKFLWLSKLKRNLLTQLTYNITLTDSGYTKKLLLFTFREKENRKKG